MHLTMPVQDPSPLILGTATIDTSTTAGYSCTYPHPVPLSFADPHGTADAQKTIRWDSIGFFSSRSIFIFLKIRFPVSSPLNPSF
jgi:hypothetical protein